VNFLLSDRLRLCVLILCMLIGVGLVDTFCVFSLYCIIFSVDFKKYSSTIRLFFLCTPVYDIDIK